MSKCTVNILGAKYTIKELSRKQDSSLYDCDGYCDKTTKEIVILQQPEDSNLGCWKVYRNKLLRHEIIHAFMFESGLAENWEHKEYGQEEHTVDWIAFQHPKMQKVFREVGCDE